MKDRKVSTVTRPPLLKSYNDLQVEHLTKSTGCSREQASEFVKSTIQTRFKDPRVKIVECPVYGTEDLTVSTLLNTVNKYNASVVTPSGSFYKPTHVERSEVPAMVVDKIELRNTLKVKQFDAEAQQNHVDARRYLYGQTSTKVEVNALPGAFGNAFNVFADKAGYNSITSCGRVLITNSCITAEEFLGGNIPFLTEEMSINYIHCCTRICPDAEVMYKILHDFGMKIPTVDDVYTYIMRILKRHAGMSEVRSIRRILESLNEPQRIFVYYANNFRHIAWESATIRSMFDNMRNTDIEIDDTADPKDIWSFDEDLVVLALFCMAPHMKDADGENIIPRTIPTEHPQLGKHIVTFERHLEKIINNFEVVLDTFIYNDMNKQRIMKSREMIRNTVAFSDTDSVGYTTEHWIEWYTGQLDELTRVSVDIMAIATYFYTKANADVMAKFSLSIGATGDDVYRMKMKNEFLYLAMLIYNIKKTYASLIAVQEGLWYSKQKPDLKGTAIRSSSVAAEAIEFSTDLIMNKILHRVQKGKISLTELIRDCRDFEVYMWESIEAGECTFVGRTSVKMTSDYKDGSKNASDYADLWNSVFDNYGDIRPPEKLSCVKLVKPNAGYYTWLEENYPKTYVKMQAYLARKGALPTSLVIAAAYNKIPPEIIPLVNIRHIVYTSIKPCHLTLEQIGCSITFDKKQVLLMDVYPA